MYSCDDPAMRLLSGQRPCRTGEGAGRDVWLHEICRGSGVALQGPRPRAKSPALQARLAELQRKLDQHQYDTMLQGIAEKVGGLRLSDLSSLSPGCSCYRQLQRGVSGNEQTHWACPSPLHSALRTCVLACTGLSQVFRPCVITWMRSAVLHVALKIDRTACDCQVVCLAAVGARSW